MNKLLFIVALFLSVPASATPYFSTIWGDPSHPQLSAGALFDNHGGPVTGFTDAALVYHPADQGPLIPFAPEKLQPFIPNMGFALLDAGAGGGSGTYEGGIGASFNVAGTLQSKLSQLLIASNKSSLVTFGELIKPGTSGLGLNGGFQFFGTVINNGTIEPFNHQNWRPGWFVGPEYKF